MNDKFKKSIEILFKPLPARKNQVMLYSCLNQYNDSPKYIAEKLHEMDDTLDIVWVSGSLAQKGKVPEYMRQVKYGTIDFLYEKARSKVIVENGVGMSSGFASGIKRKLNLMWKKKNQLDISTWHGTPLKHILGDSAEFSSRFCNEDFYSSSDLLVLSNQYESDILCRLTNHTVPIKLLGCARNDPFVNKDSEYIRALKEKLGFPSDKKVVLYAPTYREEIEYAGIQQMEDIDTEYLCKILGEKFGGEWVFAFRFHQIALQKMQNSDTFKLNDHILDGHKSSDMSEYLVACDAMITDYSSTIYDILYLNKPCFLYAPDYEEYCNSRGLYMQPSEFPFSLSKTVEELYSDIIHYDEAKANEAVNRFIGQIGGFNDGKASERIASIIVDYLRKA